MEVNRIYHGDCLELMKDIPNGSVDMILCDLPYGTIKGKNTKWDVIIPFDKLWEQYNRVIKPNCAIVLFGREPFTSLIVTSQINMYKHKWIWNKKQSGSYQNAKYSPLQLDEDIIVLGNGTVYYKPQMRQGVMRFKGGAKVNVIGGESLEKNEGYYSDQYYPINIIDLYNPKTDRIHPTQKPVELFEYLVKTYTDENFTVLDNCIGSGTTAVACLNTNRNFIGIEKDDKYFEIATKRVSEWKPAPKQEKLF